MPPRAATLTAALLVWLTATALAPASRDGWAPDATRARDYAESRLGEVSFAIRIGPVTRRHHSGSLFQARSVIKVMLMAAYMRSNRVRDRELTDEEKGLLRPMIQFSNNRAANEIAARLRSGQLYRLARAAKMTRFRYELPYWGNSTTTAADQLGLMHRLDRLIPARHARYARHLMGTITPRQRWGVADAAPDGWKVHFKSGWASGSGEQEHQVAFLTRSGCRVSLAIFTRANPSAAYARATQRGVARRLFEGLSRETC